MCPIRVCLICLISDSPFNNLHHSDMKNISLVDISKNVDLVINHIFNFICSVSSTDFTSTQYSTLIKTTDH